MPLFSVCDGMCLPPPCSQAWSAGVGDGQALPHLYPGRLLGRFACFLRVLRACGHACILMSCMHPGLLAVSCCTACRH